MTNPIKQPESYSPKTKPEILSMMDAARRVAGYPDAFTLPDRSTKIPPEIKHYGPAYMNYSNEFSNFLDYSGQGYGFLYDGDWCKDRNYTIAEVLSGHATQPMILPLTPDEERLPWKTAGFPYCHTFYADPGKPGYMSEPDMKEALKYALCALGQPVIIPYDDFFCGSIVTGYRDGGDVLVTYRFVPYFMDMENNARPKIEEITGWYKINTSLFIAGKRERALTLGDIYREGTVCIRDALEANIRGDKRHCYDDWEAFLRLDFDGMLAFAKRARSIPGGEQVPFDGNDVWKFICGACNNTWCIMAECRYYVMHFFRQAKEYFPEANTELQALDDHYWHTSEIMGNRESGYAGEIGDPINAGLFAKQDVRARMADRVRQFREADAKGLELAEALCGRLGIE